MVNYIDVTTCNKPKIRADKYDYFVKELEDFHFYEITVSVNKETRELDIHGPGWLCVSWANGIGEGSDAINPLLALLVKVLETSCLIECRENSKNENPFKSMTIEIIIDTGGYRISYFETKFTLV
jgi:hypothetical protein